MTHMLFTESKNSTLVQRVLHDETLFDLEKNPGIIVDSIPEPLNNGKIYSLHINKETLEMWYEYEELPKTEIEELRDYIDELEIAMIDLVSLIVPNGGEE